MIARPRRLPAIGGRVALHRSRRGVALILVLWLVVVLGVIGTGVVAGTRTSAAVSSNVRARLIARYAAESGIDQLVAAIEDSLARLADSSSRRDFLNALERIFPAGDTAVLGDARFAATVIDASARLDVNAAAEPSLRAFFARFADLATASTIARNIRGYIERRTDGARPDDVFMQPETGGGFRPVRPLRSLDELRDHDLVPETILDRAVAYLTIDGDGVINRRTASDTVLAAAAGELRDEPSRLVLVSRGWMGGNALSHEIQAVYSLSGDRLVLSHWRERDL